MRSKVKQHPKLPFDENLPAEQKDWKKVCFGDVVYNVDISERNPLEKGLERYVGLEHIEPESLHIKKWGLIKDGISFTRKFVKGQVLFGKRRAYQGKVAFAEFDGICSGDILVFEAKKELLIPELLPFIVQSKSFYDYALDTSVGSLSPRTKWKDLVAYEFALPPKDEQRRIADILWAADESWFLWQKALEIAQSVQQFVLKTVFNSLNVNKLPQLWQLEKLKNCALVQTGIAKGKDYSDRSVVSFPYLRVANVQDGYLDLTEIKTINVPEKDVERYSLKLGDVLLTEGGDYDKLGRGTIWRKEIDKCLHQNHVFCVRPNLKKLVPEFLSFQTSSPYGKQYFLSCSKKTTNLASINAFQVNEFPLLLTNITEQKRIVNLLSVIKVNIKNIQQHTINTTLIKKSLINKLLF